MEGRGPVVVLYAVIVSRARAPVGFPLDMECYNKWTMQDTITLPRNTFEQIEAIIRRLVAKVEPTDEEARTARKDAVALIQAVTALTDTQPVAQAEQNGAQALLELAKRAEQE